MKKYYVILAASILAAVSCSKENLNSEINVEPAEGMCECTITASNPGSKTCIGTISETAVTINWEQGDAVKVWDNVSGCTGHDFSMTAISKDHSDATFTGEVHTGATNLTIIYPAAGASGNLSSVTAPIAATQTLNNGSFASGAALSIAKATRSPGQTTISGLEFKNLCPVISFKMPSYVNAKSIVISANNNADIAGTATIDCENGTITSVSGSKTVTLSGTAAADGQFFAVIAPGTYNGGFTFTVTTSDDAVYTTATSSNITLNANGIYNLGTLGVKLSGVTVSINPRYSNNILCGSTISVSSDHASLLNKVKNLKVVLSNGQTYDLGTSASKDVEYIKKGDYTATVKYSMPSGSERTIESIATSAPAPTAMKVSANLSGYTSYSCYAGSDGQAKSASNANGKDGSTIYGVGATYATGLSQDVINQGFSVTVSPTLDGNAKSGDQSGQSWAAHTIGATWSFDGASGTCTNTKQVHVTGLPYNKNNDNAYDYYQSDWSWTKNGSWKKSDKCLNWYLADVNFKGFYIPANINATVSYRYKNYSGAYIKGYLKCSAGETVFLDKTTSGFAKWEEFKGTAAVTFSSSKNSIKCSNTGGSGATGGSVTAQMYYLGVVYR